MLDPRTGLPVEGLTPIPHAVADHDTLVRVAAELGGLADRVDAQGRSEGPGLRADAEVLRRVAGRMGTYTIDAATSPGEPSGARHD
jgi:hypothetical protein